MNTLQWLSRLIAFDTTSRLSNLALIKEVETFLKSQQIETRLIYDPSEPKANLFATIPARDGNMNGGIILSGHTDVVPVDGQLWNTNPFVATELDHHIYGRGACDMKGFLAVALALVPEFKQLALSHPIHLAFSYDEEIGCRGVCSLIDEMQSLGIKPRACIVGEPTEMRPVIAHKGIQVMRCTINGRAAHSSLTTQGCNAIDYAADIICYLRSLAHTFQENGPRDDHYDVPFTTISTNVITGGNASNIIPALCEFIFEFRQLPTMDANQIRQSIDQYIQEKILPAMKKNYSAASIVLEMISSAPGFEISSEDAFVKMAAAVSGHHDIKKVAYATEAGHFHAANIPTIVCGPGSIEQAHRANEFVAIEQLKKCEGFLRRVVTLN